MDPNEMPQTDPEMTYPNMTDEVPDSQSGGKRNMKKSKKMKKIAKF